MPFCPSCGVRAAPEAARCGLDGSLLRRLQCTQCQGEVAPADKFCGHCGCRLLQYPPLSRPLTMRPAPGWRCLAAALFDSLAWYMLLECFADLPVLLVLALVPLWTRVVECRDGSTPGQQIFSLKRLSLDGEACALGRTSRLFWV